MTSPAFGRGAVSGKRVTVLGAARSGLAAAELLARHGAAVRLSEQAPESERPGSAARMARAGVACEFGGHTEAVFAADWIVTSPGLPPSAPVLAEARRRGLPVLAELEVASWFSAAPVVAVTGSNGKSTVTTLTGKVFEAAGRPTVVAGNIGQAFSEEVAGTRADGVAVIEVSSFQLETVRTFRPAVAVFLNLTQDHLNWHGSFGAYGAAKARIFENQGPGDFLVAYAGDPAVMALARSARSRVIPFGPAPSDGPCGFVRDGRLTLRLETGEEVLLPAEALGIRGEHNVLNALASALAGRLLGAPPDAVRAALRAFRGLPHRLEFVLERDGVRWINDSKGTNVDAVRYALGSFREPVVLIAGGRDKDSDFTVLRERLSRSVRAAVLIGEAAEKMAGAFAGACPVVRADTLREAVGRARGLARPGDVVLLSPACASFDMFRNFEDRGDQYKALVREGNGP